MRKPVGGNNQGDNHKEEKPVLPLDRLKALGGVQEKTSDEPQALKMKVLERENGLYILWVQEKINAAAYMQAIADKDEELSRVRSQLAATNAELAAVHRKAAGLQKENGELFRQLIVSQHKERLEQAGYVDGARLDEMPDGKFVVIPASAPKE